MMNMDVELDGLFRQNGTYNYEEDYVYEEDVELTGGKATLIPVLYSLELVIGLLGNGLLLAVLAQKWRSWSISDTFILHLSVADLLLLVTLPFWAIQAAHQCGWCFGVFLCKSSVAVFNINFYCGIFLLVCICLDCYLSIVHNIQLYSQKKPRLACMCCLLVWLCSVILTIPDLILVEARKDSLCVPSYFQSETTQLVLRLLHHILGFLLPTVILIICCSCVLLRLQYFCKGHQKQRAVMVILPLVVVFLLCWMPYNITLIVDTFRSSSKKPDDGPDRSPEGPLKTALMVTPVLGCMHACLRPLLYFGLCGSFRKRTLAMLRCATVESESSLPWELGVGEKVLPDQSHKGEELKQMTSEDHQMLSTQRL